MPAKVKKDENALINELHSTYRTIDNHAEVIDQAFPVKEVIWGDEEVPGERTEPWQTVNTIYSVSDVDNLFETFHLHG